MNRHLAHEEADAMALVQRYLTVEDWKKTEKAANKRATGEYVRFTLPWGRYQLPPEGLEWARRMTPTGTLRGGTRLGTVAAPFVPEVGDRRIRQPLLKSSRTRQTRASR